MNKKKNPKAGTIQRGSVKHIIYEVLMSHASDTFSSQDIYDRMTKKHPNIQKLSVQNMIGHIFVKMKIVKVTDKVREAVGSHRKLKIYERITKATQPIIREPGIGPKKPRKVTKKKTADAPVLSAVELGETVIDYIQHLQQRVGELAVELDQTLIKYGDEKRAHQKNKDSMQYKVAELEKANEALKTQVKQRAKGKTFDTTSVLDFQKQRGAGGGRS